MRARHSTVIWFLLASNVGLAQGTLCTGAKFRALTSGYDPLTDSTLTMIETHTIEAGKWSANPVNGYSFFVAAAHRGRKSDSATAAYVFARGVQGARTEAGLAGLQPQFTDSTAFIALVDDTARFVWRATRYRRETANDSFWGARTIETLRFNPPPEELARFVNGKKAVVAFGPARDNVKDRSLVRFAEVVRWAQCPRDRPEPKATKP